MKISVILSTIVLLVNEHINFGRANPQGDPIGGKSPRIIGGYEADRLSHPWQVALYINKFTFCSGVLIKKQWVLTAAHCAEGAEEISIKLGAHNQAITEPSQVMFDVTKESVFVHPSFTIHNFANDIALIRLPAEVAITSEIDTIRLPGYNDPDLGDNEVVTAYGWGVTIDDNYGMASDILNKINLVTISNERCRAHYELTIPSHLCFSGGTCFGDGGGPIVIESNGKLVLRAIISFLSAEGCTSGFPHGATRIKHYLGWIEEMVGELV